KKRQQQSDNNRDEEDQVSSSKKIKRTKNSKLEKQEEDDTQTPEDKIRILASEAIHSKSKYPNIAELLEKCETDTPDVAHAAIVALSTVFVRLIQKGEMHKPPGRKVVEDSESQIVKVRLWLRDHMNLFLDLLVRRLHDEEPALQICAFDAAMNLIKEESIKVTELGKNWSFNNNMFALVVDSLVRLELDGSGEFLDHFTGYVSEYDDVLLFFRRNVAKSIQSPKASNAVANMPIRPETVYTILQALRPISGDDDFTQELLIPVTEDIISSIKKEKGEAKLDVQLALSHRRAFDESWLALLRMKLTMDVYKKVLLILHTKVIPFMSEPTKLIDFLVDSYDE
ncbi:Nucleolar complex protein 4, partial [Blyttiomyces sp. JEL0837]